MREEDPFSAGIPATVAQLACGGVGAVAALAVPDLSAGVPGVGKDAGHGLHRPGPAVTVPVAVGIGARRAGHAGVVEIAGDRGEAACGQSLREDPPDVECLDPDQRKAFDLALSGPDMLLILGPPGTGKTTTIAEIARACVLRGERVLISSQTNRAVDNVLERLPAEVRSVRVGNEARISDRVSHLTVPALAAAIRTEILDLTHPTAGNLAPWATGNGIGDGWLRRLATGVGELRRALDAEAIAVRAHEAAVAAIQTHFAPRLEEAERVLTAARTDVQRKKELVDGLAAAHRRASAKSRGVLGPFYRWRERRLQTRLATAATRLESARQAEAAAGSSWSAITISYRRSSTRRWTAGCRGIRAPNRTPGGFGSFSPSAHSNGFITPGTDVTPCS